MDESEEERPSSAPEINPDVNNQNDSEIDPEANTAETNEADDSPEDVAEEEVPEDTADKDAAEGNAKEDVPEVTADNDATEEANEEAVVVNENGENKDAIEDNDNKDEEKAPPEDNEEAQENPPRVDSGKQIEEDVLESKGETEQKEVASEKKATKRESNPKIKKSENKLGQATPPDISSETQEDISMFNPELYEQKDTEDAEEAQQEEEQEQEEPVESTVQEEDVQVEKTDEEYETVEDPIVQENDMKKLAFNQKEIENNAEEVTGQHRQTLSNRDLLNFVSIGGGNVISVEQSDKLLSENLSSGKDKVEEEPVESIIEDNPSFHYDTVLDEKEDSSGQELEVENPLTALVPVWSFGINRNIPVINLSTDIRGLIFYTCAHLGILYQYEHNRQTVLQGHSNPITCTAASLDKRWLVTGDKGKNSMVIIWDSNTGIPVRSMFEPHDDGVVAVAITPDARYLATIGAPPHQMFAVWDWTTGEEFPVVSCSIDIKFGVQSYLMFDPSDSCYLVSNSDSQVIFYCWKNQTLEYFAPPLTEKDFNKPVGKFSMSVFLPNSTKALTATSQGLCAVWDSNKPLIKVSKEATANKKAVKLVPMHDRAITVLLVQESFIVTGDTAGHVKFFDHNLMLMYWYDNFNFGPINAISFQYTPTDSASVPSKKKQDFSMFPTDSTIPENHFVVEDFVIGTSNAIFASVTVEGSYVDIIIRDHDSSIDSIAAHPAQEKVATAGLSGLLKIWNYRTRITLISRYFDRNNQITAIAFDPKGIFLAAGFANGQVRILDAETLHDVCKEPFSYAREKISKIVFSDDSKLMATVDLGCTTSLYEAGPLTEPWIYLGRHKAHYKPIKDIMFGLHVDTSEPRLLSIGEDRLLVEYDLQTAARDNLPVLSANKIEQSALPLCMTWYPCDSKEQFILTSNKEFKFKLNNSTTFMCRKTILSPTYGSPVEKMIVLPNVNKKEDQREYLIFHIHDQVGMVMLPLDGNPHNAMSMVAHPSGISNLACSFDGQFVFTSGGADSTVHMWRVCKNVLDAQSKLGGDALVPFYDLLEGGREGELFAQMEDYFYYAQLRSQGIDTTDTRSVSTKMPVSEIPFVMRALGFYPTEQEIENMLNEVKFMEFVETGQFKQDLDLGEFIKLYINHRPAFGLSLEKIQWAFDVLGIQSTNNETGEEEQGLPSAIRREDLFDMLQSKGEHMMEYELAEYLTTLLGFNPEGGSCELDEFDPSSAGDLLESHISQYVTAEQFASGILCLGPSILAPNSPGGVTPADTIVPTERANSVSQQSQTCHLVDI